MWDKFLALPTWKQLLVTLVAIILLPVTAVILLLYFQKDRSTSNKVLQKSMETLKEHSERQIEEAEEKDKDLKKQQEQISAQCKAIMEHLDKNSSIHAITKQKISEADSIEELREIARDLGDKYADDN